MQMTLSPTVNCAVGAWVLAIAGCASRPPSTTTSTSKPSDTTSVPLPASSTSATPKVASNTPDPWAGPLDWARSTLACTPVVGSAPKSPSKQWRSFATGTIANLQAVAVSPANADEATIVGSEGTILFTRDHGQSFIRCTIESKESLTAVAMLTADDVWILSDTHAFHVEWQSSVASSPAKLEGSSDMEASLLVSSAREIWIGSHDRLRHTLDGGRTWTSPFAPRLGSFQCIDCIVGDASELFTACNFAVTHSTDGGVTWSPIGYEGIHTEERLHIAAGPDDLWVVGQDSGETGRSTDHGATWEYGGLPLNPPLTEPRHVWRLWSGGKGFAWAMADGLWMRAGKGPWKRDLPADVGVYVGGSSHQDVWAAGEKGLLLHRL